MNKQELFAVTLGRVLQAWLSEASMTQAKLSQSIGVAQSTVSRWVGGMVVPNVHVLRQTCNVLNSTLEDLLATVDDVMERARTVATSLGVDLYEASAVDALIDFVVANLEA